MNPFLTPSPDFTSTGQLPERLFQVDCYPGHAVRINSYSKPEYLIDILHVLEGLPELKLLLASPLGSLFRLPVRQCSLSGQLVHQMLCRQLCSDNSEEMWFVFGGQPLKFSLSEFQEITGLCCSPLPPVNEIVTATTHASGNAPYWYQLIGHKIGSTTVKDIVNMLKTEPGMPVWRKFRLCLIVIVEGILLCRTQPLKPSQEVVEMVKNVQFFLNYPWGRHSFTRLLRMVTIGDYMPDKTSLLKKLKQSSLAVHGFPLALQFFAFHSIPLLLKFLSYGEDRSTFLDQVVTRLPKCKSFHTSKILVVENDPLVQVLFPRPLNPKFSHSGEGDPRVRQLECLISAGYEFTKQTWCGGDCSLPSLYTSHKRKDGDHQLHPSSSGSADRRPYSRQRTNVSNFKTALEVDLIVERKLKAFKESLLADCRGIVFNGKPDQNGSIGSAINDNDACTMEVAIVSDEASSQGNFNHLSTVQNKVPKQQHVSLIVEAKAFLVSASSSEDNETQLGHPSTQAALYNASSISPESSTTEGYPIVEPHNDDSSHPNCRQSQCQSDEPLRSSSV